MKKAVLVLVLLVLISFVQAKIIVVEETDKNSTTSDISNSSLEVSIESIEQMDGGLNLIYLVKNGSGDADVNVYLMDGETITNEYEDKVFLNSSLERDNFFIENINSGEYILEISVKTSSETSSAKESVVVKSRGNTGLAVYTNSSNNSSYLLFVSLGLFVVFMILRKLASFKNKDEHLSQLKQGFERIKPDRNVVE